MMSLNGSEGDAVIMNYGRPAISIIVPVYNTAAYLRECINSVLVQSFTEWELLLVDDGSTDQSGAICDEYAASDYRIHVAHRPHLGVSAARNYGLDSCRGEYLTFIDSDDVLLSDEYLKTLYELVVDNGADASICGVAKFEDGDLLPSPSVLFSDTRILSGREFLFAKGLDEGYNSAYLTKTLFRMNVFKGIRFPEGLTREDAAIGAHVFYPCKKIVITGIQMYGYRQRSDNSVTSEPLYRQYIDLTRSLQMRIQYLLEQNEPELANKSRTFMNKSRGYYHFKVKKAKETNFIPQEYRIDDATAFEYLLGSIGYHKTKSFIDLLFPDDFEILDMLSRENKHRISLCHKLACQVLLKDKEVPWEDIQLHVTSIVRTARDEGVLFLICEALCHYSELEEYKRRKFKRYQKQIIRNWIRENEIEERIRNEATTNDDYVMLDLHFLNDLYPAPWYREDVVNHSQFPFALGKRFLEIFNKKDPTAFIETVEGQPGRCHIFLKKEMELSPGEICSLLSERMELFEQHRLAYCIELELYQRKVF